MRISRYVRELAYDFIVALATISSIVGFIITLTIVFMLTGCSAKPKVIYVHKTKVEYVTIPDELIRDDIEIPKPIDRKRYIESDPYEKSRYDAMLIIDLYKTIGLYKNKLRYIRDYVLNAKKKQDNNDTKNIYK